MWTAGENLCGNDHVIGDGGYPVGRWLLTPYRDTGRLNPQQNHYNFCLSSTRQVAERSFGLLKGRFRRLQYVDVQEVETAVQLCMCCCVFHNIWVLQADMLDEYFYDVGQNQDGPVGIPFSGDIDPEGARKRDRIAQILR